MCELFSWIGSYKLCDADIYNLNVRRLLPNFTLFVCNHHVHRPRTFILKENIYFNNHTCLYKFRNQILTTFIYIIDWSRCSKWFLGLDILTGQILWNWNYCYKFENSFSSQLMYIGRIWWLSQVQEEIS